MISIRYRLVGLILTTLLLGTALMTGLTFHFVHEEFSEIMDGSLKQMAKSVAPQINPSAAAEVSPITSLKEEDDFLIQVWLRNKLIYSSHPNIPLTLQSPGLGDVSVNGEGLRYYHHPSKGRVVQVAHSLNERNEMEWDIVSHFVGPILVLLPIIMVLTYINIGIGLSPLAAASARVRERSAQNLKPIDTEGMPQEILSLIQALNSLLSRLEESVGLQRQFTADAAHELRTPLTAIDLQVQMLPRAEDAKERNQLEEKLKLSVARAKNLVEGLLRMARHETDAMAKDLEAVDLAVIATQVVNQTQPLAATKSTDLSVAPTSAKSAAICAHSYNITVLLENLVENAVHYTGEHGQVVVKVAVEEGNAIVTVADDGPGIPPAERERVFDRFYRLSGTAAQGSGLGLSIVKQVAAYYRGKMRISEGLGGKGCSMTATFPLAKGSKG